jgi:hypothetical protein
VDPSLRRSAFRLCSMNCVYIGLYIYIYIYIYIYMGTTILVGQMFACCTDELTTEKRYWATAAISDFNEIPDVTDETQCRIKLTSGQSRQLPMGPATLGAPRQKDNSLGLNLITVDNCHDTTRPQKFDCIWASTVLNQALMRRMC